MTENELWIAIQQVDRHVRAAEADALISRCGWCGCQVYADQQCPACRNSLREAAA